MLTPVEAFIGVRYIHARRGDHFIAFMSATAIVATALGVAVLITILSIMNGFEGELRDRILGMAPHVTVESHGAAAADWPALAATVQAREGVRAAAPYVSRDVLLSNAGVVRAVKLNGVVPGEERRVSEVDGHMVAGALDALDGGRFRIVLGAELATTLGLAVGDRVTAILPEPQVTPAGFLPRVKRFELAGLFEFGLHEHDGGVGLISLRDAQRLFRTGARVDGVRAVLEDAAAAPAVAAAMRAGWPAGEATVTDWTQTHRNLFTALKTEKIAMFAILVSAVAIAAFNIVSILVMAVNEKRGDIAMLRTLGLQRGRVMRIFLVQGGITGGLGVLLGLVAGVALALNVDGVVASLEAVLGFKFLSPDVFYISNVPSELRAPDVVVTGLVAAALAIAAPLYPAWLASRIDPAAALRHD